MISGNPDANLEATTATAADPIIPNQAIFAFFLMFASII